MIKKSKLPEIKKDIRVFLSSEEGKINKKSVADLGMMMIVLGMGVAGVMKSDQAQANCTHASHANHSSHSSHSSHSNHANHGSHSSHSSHSNHANHANHGSHGNY